MLCAKLRRAMVNPERAALSGLVEADETIIPFRTKKHSEADIEALVTALSEVWSRLTRRRAAW